MSETQETEARSVTPGRMLKRAREAKNLSVAAIATQMNLDLRTIEALERDDHANLPAPIFVRGYLRGYARLVDLREAEVLGAYQAQAPREPEPRAVGMTAAPLRPAFRAPVIPWRGLLLTAVALGVAAVGFLYGPHWLRTFTAPAPEADVTAPEASVGAGLSLPAAEPSTPTAELPAAQATPPADTSAGPAAETADQNGALQLALPPPEPSVARDTPPESVSAPEPAGAEESDFGVPQGTTPATGEPTPDTPTATGPATADASAVPDTSAAQADASSAPAAAPASGEVHMAFTFNAESWVEVRDAGGNKLLFDLMHKGDTREISGKAPISLLIGNAGSVELRVNGERYDLAPHSRDDVARLRIEAGR